MGRIIRVGSGPPIPAGNTNMGFRMTKLSPPAEEVEVKTEYVLNVLPKWMSIFSNTSWEPWHDDGPPHATWWDALNYRWVSGDWFFNIELRVLSDCFTNFRPTKCRFEFSKTVPAHVVLRDVDFSTIASSVGDYISMAEIDLDFSLGKDIYSIYAPTGDTVTTCTKIEFYGLME